MTTLLSMYPVVLLYGLVAVLKLAGTDWATDLPGMHAGIGAMFLMFGASVCHLVFVYQLHKPLKSYRLHQSFWVTGTIAFLLMFLDSSFGVHERYSAMLGIPEVLFLLAYGLMFGLSVLVNIRKVGLHFLSFFVGFGIVSLIAVAGDMSTAHEGLFTLNGTAYSYEQTMETLGCLLLACAYGCGALRSILPAPVAAVVVVHESFGAGAKADRGGSIAPVQDAAAA